MYLFFIICFVWTIMGYCTSDMWGIPLKKNPVPIPFVTCMYFNSNSFCNILENTRVPSKPTVSSREGWPEMLKHGVTWCFVKINSIPIPFGQFLNSFFYVVIMSPLPLGRGWTSRITVVSRQPNVSRRLRPHLCQSLLTRYFLQFVADSFQILRYSDHGQDLNLLTFRDIVSIFKFTGGHYVSKLTLFTQYFL